MNRSPSLPFIARAANGCLKNRLSSGNRRNWGAGGGFKKILPGSSDGDERGWGSPHPGALRRRLTAYEVLVCCVAWLLGVINSIMFCNYPLCVHCGPRGPKLRPMGAAASSFAEQPQRPRLNSCTRKLFVHSFDSDCSLGRIRRWQFVAACNDKTMLNFLI